MDVRTARASECRSDHDGSPNIDWEAIAGLPESQLYASGAELLAQDDTVRAVHLIRKGLVKLVHMAPGGRAMICGIHTAGSLIGAAEAVLGRPSPTAAITVVPTSTSRLCVAEFRHLVTTDLAFSAAVVHSVSRDAHQATMESIALGSYPAQVRLQRLLSQLASDSLPAGKLGRLRLSLPVKQYEIAELLAVTPAYLCRLLGRLEKEGRIERDKGWILVPQSDRTPS